MNRLFYTPQCTSTNDEIVRFLDSSEQVDSLTLYTFDQTHGRGQYGNTWDIAPHQNLAFSMLFGQEKIKCSDVLLNYHTANILREFMDKKTEKCVEIKWPNDIIISGKKVSGILIEKKSIHKKVFFILGIGINILQENFGTMSKAGSLYTQTHRRFDLVEWAEEMHAFFVSRLFSIPDEEEILEQYHQFLFRKNQVSVFNLQEMRQNGIIQRVDKDGFLWVELEKDGLRKFYHKEIELLY